MGAHGLSRSDLLFPVRSPCFYPRMPDGTPPSQPPGDRALILACSVRRLRRWWLEVRCPCHVVHLPLRQMAMHREVAAQSLADVLVQLRFQKCGQRPIRVALEEDAAAGPPGRMGGGTG
jgi:hypothetical protein